MLLGLLGFNLWCFGRLLLLHVNVSKAFVVA